MPMRKKDRCKPGCGGKSHDFEALQGQDPPGVWRFTFLALLSLHIVDIDSCVLILMAAADYIPDDIFR